jgi:hypothetical protein
MIQLYQLKFCGYACSQCLLLCFSVAQRHQEAVTTVNIDGHDDYHAWICEYRKHASTPAIWLYTQNGPAVSVEILWLRL